MKKTKLNKLQDGSLQLAFSIALVMVCFALAQAIMGDILRDDAPVTWLVKLSLIVFFAVVVGLLSYYSTIVSMKCNLVLPVTLPKIIEFSHAMRRLHILNFDKQVDFIAEKGIDIFLSSNPLLATIEENISVKKYIALRHRKALKFYNGDNRLCLDFDDYEQFLHEQEETSHSIYASKIVTLEENITALKATNSILRDDITKLEQDKTEYYSELAELKKKQQTTFARDAKAEKREHDRIVFWRVTAPTINRLLAEATPTTLYTRPQIQAAFEDELESFPDLKPAIAALLETPKKKEDGKPYDLEGWAMDSIRKGLGEYVKR